MLVCVDGFPVAAVPWLYHRNKGEGDTCGTAGVNFMSDDRVDDNSGAILTHVLVMSDV